VNADPDTLINPMWDAVKHAVKPWAPEMTADRDGTDPTIRRSKLVGQYAWTITSPETVAFVAAHAGAKVLDPLAGSGYWAYLLGQLGVDVFASDAEPPNLGVNPYHHTDAVHVPVARLDALESVATHGDGRVLLLSWPPHNTPLGAQILQCYPGDRVIYIGDRAGGGCGDAELFHIFDRYWTQVAVHLPVRFWGIHDRIVVYDRGKGSS